MIIFPFTLFLCLIHIGFLCAISIRLSRIGLSSRGILGLIGFSLGIWPLIVGFGYWLDILAMWSWGGLPFVIMLTLFAYVGIEIKIMLESKDEQKKRSEIILKEENGHRVAVENDATILSALTVVKTYVGEDQLLVAISDLNKLKENRIPCRMEGAFVRSLMVRESDIDVTVIILDNCCVSRV